MSATLVEDDINAVVCGEYQGQFVISFANNNNSTYNSISVDIFNRDAIIKAKGLKAVFSMTDIDYFRYTITTNNYGELELRFADALEWHQIPNSRIIKFGKISEQCWEKFVEAVGTMVTLQKLEGH